MKIRDSMFGFEVEVKQFDFTQRKPRPPEGYIEYNCHRNNAQSGKCPNCGELKPGTVGVSDGFQDRQIQNVWKAMGRLERRGGSSKNSYELFSVDLDSAQPKYSTMLKCHPSRYGTGKLTCCGAKIWHDFFGYPWNYYFKPTPKNKNTLQNWIKDKE